MVARSETGTADLVTREELQALTLSLNNTMEELKATFTIIDRKFSSVEQEVMHTQAMTTAKMTSFEELINEIGHQTKEQMGRIEHLHGKTMSMEVSIEEWETHAESVNEHMNSQMLMASQRIVELERLMVLSESASSQHHARLNRVESSPNNGGPRKNANDILDPRYLTVTTFDGNKRTSTNGVNLSKYMLEGFTQNQTRL